MTSRSKALLLAAVAFGAAAFARAPLHQPVLTENFPDPHIIKVGDRYIAYSTTTARKNVPVALSRDLVQWRRLTDPKNKGQLYDAMPTLPAWAGTGFTWAPEVLPVEGGYRLYFSAPHKKRDVQCVGVATSSDPLGPFRPHGAEPIVCQPELGGTIDAHPFRDTDGKLYLYYKNDGNNPRFLKPSQIWVQRMAADGLSVSGPAVPLVKNDTHWEWRVVEAPAMVRHERGYTLFFAANHFGWEADQRLSNYGTGYANCAGPMGPCRDADTKPWLGSYNDRTRGCLSGPGHAGVLEAGGKRYLAFHAWAATAGCRKADNERYLYVAPLRFENGRPVLGPSLRPGKSN